MLDGSGINKGGEGCPTHSRMASSVEGRGVVVVATKLGSTKSRSSVPRTTRSYLNRGGGGDGGEAGGEERSSVWVGTSEVPRLVPTPPYRLSTTASPSPSSRPLRKVGPKPASSVVAFVAPSRRTTQWSATTLIECGMISPPAPIVVASRSNTYLNEFGLRLGVLGSMLVGADVEEQSGSSPKQNPPSLHKPLRTERVRVQVEQVWHLVVARVRRKLHKRDPARLVRTAIAGQLGRGRWRGGRVLSAQSVAFRATPAACYPKCLHLSPQSGNHLVQVRHLPHLRV